MRLLWFIAWRQLWAHKLLMGIAVLGVMLGVMMLIVMNAIMQGFQMKFKSEILRISPHVVLLDKKLGQDPSLGRLLFTGPTAFRLLHPEPGDRHDRIERPLDVVRTLEALPEVEAACQGLAGQAILSRGAQDLGVDLRGVLPVSQERCTPMSHSVVAGTFQGLDAASDGVVLGQGVADALGAQLGDRLRLVAPGGAPLSLRVIGVFDTGVPAVDKVRVYVRLHAAQEVLRRPSQVGRVEVRLRDPWTATAFAARVRAMTGHDAEGWLEQNANFLSLFDLQERVVAMVIGTVLLVGGFGILAVQIMSVLQKTRDVSILRSVGLRRRDILIGFLMQGAVVALSGATLGCLAGWRLVAFLGTLHVKSEGILKSNVFVVYEDPMFYVYGFVFALVTGLTASLLPALRASKVEPVEVLRGQIG